MKISIKKEFRNNGLFTVNEDIWNIFLSFDNGVFSENGNNYILTTKDEKIYTFQKNRELSIVKNQNRYIDADLSLHNLYESESNDFGALILYIPKNEELNNQPIISTVGGIMGGSSIWLELKDI